MEGIITFIVIIIIFNLLNRLAGAAKRKQQPVSRRRTYDQSRPLPERPVERKEEEPRYFRSARPEDLFAGLEEDDENEEDEEDDESGYEVDRQEEWQAETGTEEALIKKRRAEKSAPTALSSNKLGQLLSDKDSLVAAFIFHEAISGPPALRRKGKTVFSRLR